MEDGKPDIKYSIVQITIPKKSNVENEFTISFDYGAIDLHGTKAQMNHQNAMKKFKKKWEEDVLANMTTKTMKSKSVVSEVIFSIAFWKGIQRAIRSRNKSKEVLHFLFSTSCMSLFRPALRKQKQRQANAGSPPAR